MILRVVNNFGKEFEYYYNGDSADFNAETDGFELFLQAQAEWGDLWHTYEVFDCDDVITRVINPNLPFTLAKVH